MQHILIKKITKNKNYQKYLKIFKSEKLNKINKLQKEEDKKRSILGEMLFIKGIKKFYNINYQDILVEYNEFGKPYITNYNIFFNISHSDDYVVCVFSTKEIGVDIEKVKKVNTSIIKKFYTPKEQEYVKTPKNFFEIFTLKEAYIKCIGKNFSLFKDIEFTIKENKITCNDSSVTCKQLLKENYIISIIEKR